MDLPGHFRTEFRNEYLHGSTGHACPKVRRNGLKCSIHGRGMHEGEQVRLFTSRSMWTSMHYATKFDLKFYSKEDNCFEDNPYREVSKYFQMVYAIQGKAEHPHHYERLKGHNRNAAKRAKLHQYTHFEGEFKILYVIITSPDGPELGKQNRADISECEVGRSRNVKDPKVALKRVIKQCERRHRIDVCLFWVPE